MAQSTIHCVQNMWMYIHMSAGALFSPLSVLLNTRRDKHMTKGWSLAVSWPFHPAVLPHSWPHCLTRPAVPKLVGGAAVRLEQHGGFRHTVVQVLLTRLGPIWERGEVSERVGPAATHSLSRWNRMGIYLFMPYRIMFPQSVQIIDLFGRRQNCPLQDVIQKWVKSPCHHLDYSDASHLLCNGLWHQSVIWTNSEAAGAHFAGCGPDGHEYGNRVCSASS